MSFVSILVLVAIGAIFVWMYFTIAKPFFEELSTLKEDTYKLSLFITGLFIKNEQLARKIYNYDICSKCPMFKNCNELNEHRMNKFGSIIRDFRTVHPEDINNQINELCNTCYFLSKEYASAPQEGIDLKTVHFEDLEFKVEYSSFYEHWVGTCSIFPKMCSLGNTQEEALANVKECTKNMLEFGINHGLDEYVQSLRTTEPSVTKDE